MREVHNRVIAWNKARYEQKYDHQLCLKLLSEEYQEFWEAEKPVDEVDALCDIIFVAIGALWKLDVDELATMERSHIVVQVLSELQEVWPVAYISSFLAMGAGTQYSPCSMLWNIIQCATAQLGMMGFTEATIKECLLAVCDSNDSKPVVKTASDTKANVDKGPNFVPPEPKLLEIMEKANVG